MFGAIWALAPHTINTEWIFIFLQTFIYKTAKQIKVVHTKPSHFTMHVTYEAILSMVKGKTSTAALPNNEHSSPSLARSLCVRLFLCSIALRMQSCNHKYKLRRVHTKNASNIRFSTSKVYILVYTTFQPLLDYLRIHLNPFFVLFHLKWKSFVSHFLQHTHTHSHW